MNTNNTDKERISAFADGELSDGEVEAALSALRDSEGCAAWDAYHRVGDVLRSEDLAIAMSAGFSSKLASRLADEPAIVAPASREGTARMTMRRFGLPGFAAAAAATVAAAWIAAPQLLVASKQLVKSEPPSISVASAPVPQQISQQPAPVASANPEMLRDSRLDAYLLAHQRFSPVLYSTAQYARSATFAAEGDK